jgi:hypothetical protein
VSPNEAEIAAAHFVLQDRCSFSERPATIVGQRPESVFATRSRALLRFLVYGERRTGAKMIDRKPEVPTDPLVGNPGHSGRHRLGAELALKGREAPGQWDCFSGGGQILWGALK